MSIGAPESGDPTLVCLNGAYLPASEARIPVSDRSFLYGDAVFETLRVYQGIPFAWERHLERLARGAALLGIVPPSPNELREQSRGLLRRERCQEAVLRIHLSRGVGVRGYAPGSAGPPVTLVSLGPAPAIRGANPREVSLVTSSIRLPTGRQLADCKSANRLLQVLACAEAAQVGADEPLMLNTQDEVVEAASANFFWVDGGVLATTPLESGALNGVTRALVKEIARDVGWAVEEWSLPREACKGIQAAFLTSSVREIQQVKRLDGRELSPGRHVEELHRAYAERVRNECG